VWRQGKVKAVADVEAPVSHPIAAVPVKVGDKPAKKKKTVEGKPAEESYSHDVIHVGHAVQKVWDMSKAADDKAKWAKDRKHPHWHCRHCHAQCKTDHCRNWCHNTFCGPPVNTGKNAIKLTGFDTESTPVQVSGHLANEELKVATKATVLSKIRKAGRAVDHFREMQQADLAHFKREIRREDDLDKASYPDRAQRKRKEKTQKALEKLHRRASERAHKAFIRKAHANIESDTAYVKAVRAQNRVQEEINEDQPNWASDMLKLAKADATAKPKKFSAVTSTTKVAAKLAAMQAQVQNIKSQMKSKP